MSVRRFGLYIPDHVYSPHGKWPRCSQNIQRQGQSVDIVRKRHSFNPDSAKILNDGTSTSNGSTTSIPYTNENGVAPVDVHTEV